MLLLDFISSHPYGGERPVTITYTLHFYLAVVLILSHFNSFIPSRTFIHLEIRIVHDGPGSYVYSTMTNDAMSNDDKSWKMTEKSDASLNSVAGRSGPQMESVATYDPKLDRTILWKRDIALIPFAGILYMLLFLDRTNIANARSLHLGQPNSLEASLSMPSNGFNTALWIFYIPFVVAEVPANLLLNRNFVRPGVFLGCQTFLLGRSGPCDVQLHSTDGNQVSSACARA